MSQHFFPEKHLQLAPLKTPSISMESMWSSQKIGVWRRAIGFVEKEHSTASHWRSVSLLNRHPTSNNRNVSSTWRKLRVGQRQRASRRINPKTFNAVGVLAGHKHILAAWVQREVSGIGVRRKGVAAGKCQPAIGRVHTEHGDALVDPADVVIM